MEGGGLQRHGKGLPVGAGGSFRKADPGFTGLPGKNFWRETLIIKRSVAVRP
jgi:hypothetical protein